MEISATASAPMQPLQQSSPEAEQNSAASSEAKPKTQAGGGGVPGGSVSSEEDLTEAAVKAAIARIQAQVGSAEAEDIVSDDGTIDYAKLAQVIEQQKQSNPLRNNLAGGAPIVDLVA